MKAFYAVLLVVFLSSCGASDIVVPETSIGVEAIEQTAEEIDQAVSELPEEIKAIMIDEGEGENYGDDNNDGEGEKMEKTDATEVQAEVSSEVKEEEFTPIPSKTEISENASDEQASVELKVVELSTTYTNPAMEVVMNIEYTLDSDNTITSISVTSPNYKGMPGFNTGAQGVIGMSVGEASKYSVAGSSLTTPAFQSALKNG